MSKFKRYRADYLFDGNELGIGITEHGEKWNEETIAIHSIYVGKRISNRDASIIIFQSIYSDLKDDEQAILQMNRYSYSKHWDAPYRGRMNVQYIDKVRGQVYQNTLLAKDAIKRKSDITEVFSQPIRFSTVQQEQEEVGK